MWEVLESKQVEKTLDKIQSDIVERYEFWKSIIRTQGPEGVKSFTPFKDHPLKGNLKGMRSSRLKDKWKIVYRIVDGRCLVEAIQITPDDYRNV